MNANLKHLPFFSTWFTAIQGQFTMGYQMYILYHIAHIICIFSQWMQVLPLENEQVLLLWRHSVVLAFVQYFYLDCRIFPG